MLGTAKVSYYLTPLCLSLAELKVELLSFMLSFICVVFIYYIRWLELQTCSDI